MNIIRTIITDFKSKKHGFFLLTLGFCAFLSLTFAYIAEFLGYKPCILCLYQRIPFAIIFFSAIIAFKFQKTTRFFAYLCVLSIIANLFVSGYHSGVEHGVFDGPKNCVSTNIANVSSTAELKKIIESTETVSCKEPALKIFGISMAEWNFIWNLCLLLYAALMLGVKKIGKIPS